MLCQKAHDTGALSSFSTVSKRFSSLRSFFSSLTVGISASFSSNFAIYCLLNLFYGSIFAYVSVFSSLRGKFSDSSMISDKCTQKGYRCRTAPFCCLIIPLSFALNQHLHINHFYIPQSLSVCVHLHYAISQ